jgi:hypothetical protein
MTMPAMAPPAMRRTLLPLRVRASTGRACVARMVSAARDVERMVFDMGA